ncbi:MAG: DUF2961 domain-containing protein, partial [Mycobacteriales bacterium]
YGQPVADREDWAGFSNLYRFHIADPIPFTRSIRATLEHGHANDRADDWSSVAYWYQVDRTTALPALPGLVDREPPWPTAWKARAEAVRAVYAEEFAGPADPGRRARFVTGVGYLARAAHRRDWTGIDRALEWLTGAPRNPTVTRSARSESSSPGRLHPLRGAADAVLASWVESTSPAEVLDAVLADWVARFDTEEAGRAELTIGLRVAAATTELAASQIAIRAGGCRSRPGSGEPERLTLLADPLTLVRWTLGRLDPWEAVLRGSLVVRGDGNLALRLPALFPPPTPPPESNA